MKTTTRFGGANRSFGPVVPARPGLESTGMNAGTSAWRVIWCAAGIALSAALVTGCGGGRAAQGADPPLQVRYRDSQVSFRHPAPWKVYPFRWAGELHFRPSFYLSTQPVQDPCRTNGNSTVCGLPLRHLRPGGVLVVWQVLGIPGTGLGPGRRIRVGGRPAAQATTRAGICRTIDADRTIEVLVETSPPPSNFTEVIACLRGPHLAQNERRVNALLASARFQSG